MASSSSSSSVHRVHSEHGRSWFIKLPISCNTHIHAHAIHTQHTQHTHTTYATHTAHTHTQNTQHTQHRHTQSNNTHTTHTSHKHNTHTEYQMETEPNLSNKIVYTLQSIDCEGFSAQEELDFVENHDFSRPVSVFHQNLGDQSSVYLPIRCSSLKYMLC